ncbi:Endonuclease/exonuclease/phosphatase family domain-containing protein 1, partial [Ophiophagus hannah]
MLQCDELLLFPSNFLQFCTELNQPTLPNIRKWKGPRGCWKGSISEKLSGHPEKRVEYSGFLWDTTAGIELKEASFSEGPHTNGSGIQVHLHPYIAHFKARPLPSLPVSPQRPDLDAKHQLCIGGGAWCDLAQQRDWQCRRPCSLGIMFPHCASAWLLSLLNLLLLASWGLFALLALLSSADLLGFSCLVWGKIAQISDLWIPSPTSLHQQSLVGPCRCINCRLWAAERQLHTYLHANEATRAPAGKRLGLQRSSRYLTQDEARHNDSEKDVVILGDFSQPPDSSDYDLLRKEKFHHLVPASTFTNISTKNPQGSKSLDNIWISRGLKKIFTGHWTVVREGLTNPWIPDNWSWGGVASSHCPVLAEFYIERDWNKKDLTRNGGGVLVECTDVNSKHER